MDSPLLEAGHGQLRLSAKALVHATVVWGVLGAFVSFVLFWVFHDDDDLEHVNGYDQIPTFSWAGAYMPQSILFTLGLHALGFVGAVLFALVYDVRRSCSGRTSNHVPLTCDASLLLRGLDNRCSRRRSTPTSRWRTRSGCTS
jgi:hypothetical protein